MFLTGTSSHLTHLLCLHVVIFEYNRKILKIFYMNVYIEMLVFCQILHHKLWKADVCASAVLGHSVGKAMVNGDEAHMLPEEAELKQDGNGITDSGEDSNEQEVIVIQDTGFTVKIQAPGTEPFDLQARIAA